MDNLVASLETSVRWHEQLNLGLHRLFVQSIFFGLYSLLVLTSALSLFRSGARSRAKTAVLAACVAMYASAAAYFLLGFRSFGAEYAVVAAHAGSLLECANEIGAGAPDAAACASGWAPAGPAQSCAQSVLLAVNIVLSDALVAWRVCVIWTQSKTIKLLAAVLVGTTAAMTFLSTGLNSCSAYSPAQATADWHAGLVSGQQSGDEFVDHYGSVAMVLSWATNVLATVALSYKAWVHRRIIRDDLRQGSSRTYAEKILMLFVESGVVYSVFWTLLVAGSFANLAPSAPGTTGYLHFILVLKSTALINLVGMYPTLVIILVSFTKTATQPDVSLPTANASRLPPHSRHTSTSSSCWSRWSLSRVFVEPLDVRCAVIHARNPEAEK